MVGSRITLKRRIYDGPSWRRIVIGRRGDSGTLVSLAPSANFDYRIVLDRHPANPMLVREEEISILASNDEGTS